MFAIGEDNLRPLTAKLERLAGLDQEDRKAIQNLPMSVKPARPNSYLVREGGTASACCLLIDGYACRHKTASNGERQIVSFQLPGDTPRMMLDIGLGENQLRPVLQTVCIRLEEMQVDLIWRGAHEYPGLEWLPEMKKRIVEVN